MKIYSICLTVLMLLFIAPVAYGCVCIAFTPEMAFENAKVVFIGKMIGGTEKNVGNNADPSKPTLEAGEVTFEIDAFDDYKGLPGKGSITLKVPSNTTCGPYGLIPGERYVVYAYSDDPERTLYTGACTRTALLSEANEDIEFFSRLNEIGYGTIKGYVWLDTHRIENSDGPPYSLPDIKLRFTGPDTALTVEIDKSGNFETTGLRAGTYHVTLELPPDYESRKEIEEVTIRGRPNHYLSFMAQYKGRVSGVIQDSEGAAYNQNFIYLENSNTRVPGGSLGQDGRFEIEGVPPGEYLMYMEIRNEDIYKNRKYYYPGTYDAAQATKLKVGLSETKSGLKFTLPVEFRVRTVSGTIVWPDGKPAADIELSLRCPVSFKKYGFTPENFPSFARTNSNGEFSLRAIGGMSYWLEAMGRNKDGATVHSTPVRIVLNKDFARMKLVLSKSGFTAGCPVPFAYPAL